MAAKMLGIFLIRIKIYLKDYLKYIEYKNISNSNFAIFRYTEEDFNMTEDYEIGFRK